MSRNLIALVLVFLLPACGNNNKPTAASTPNPTATVGPTVGQVAKITISAQPVLVPAVASSTPGYQWQISWQLNIAETGGVSATLTEVDVVIDNSIITFGSSALLAQSTSGSAALAANGSLTLNESIAYSFANGGRLATVVIVGFFTDANGNRIQKSTQIRII